jgi:hypothetical protein
MAHKFQLNNASLKREFAVYVVVIKSKKDTKLYVGKTGDNREGCNPIISRCGNHFSYNNIHSQIRNKIKDHEKWDYTYVFDHFGLYSNKRSENKKLVDEINEMERWLNSEIQLLSKSIMNCKVINPHKGKSRINKDEKENRISFHTKENELKIHGICEAVKAEIIN